MKLVVIDGNGLIHRAFHAINKGLSTSEGFPTNAIFGFTAMLLNILERERPEYIAVTFDRKEKTFRHEEYAEYKAGREKSPADLCDQIPKIWELVEKMNIPHFSKAGFEADDLMGTISKLSEQIDDIQTLIITSDQDILQLVSDRVYVSNPIKGYRENRIMNPESIRTNYGIESSQIPDLKGLAGDSSDNIKGVAGIGEKGASKLIGEFGSVENLYQNLDKVSENIRAKLLADRESAFQSKRLATIDRDVDIDFELDACQTHDFELDTVIAFLEELEMNTLIGRMKKIHKLLHHHNGSKFDENIPQQTSLF